MKWYPIWSYHFQNYESLPAVSVGITQFIRFTSVVNGKKLRILFSNENGEKSVSYRCGRVKNQKEEREITWDGKTEICLNSGETKVTDEIEIAIKKGEPFIIEVQPEGEITGYAGLNNAALFQVEFRNPFDQLVAPTKISEVAKRLFNNYVYFGIRNIEIMTEEEPEVITVFGDSLVHQGHWFQEMYRMYLENGQPEILLNEGISGNRVLRNANTKSSLNTIFGEAGIRRIERDVFLRYQPDRVILAEGINDLVHPGNSCPIEELPESEELIEGLRKLCRIVEAHGSEVVLATLSPFCGYDESWTEKKERIRQEVNEWIRSQKYVIDIDAYVREPEQMIYLKEEYDSGDSLHFNQTGGKQIAERWLEL